MAKSQMAKSKGKLAEWWGEISPLGKFLLLALAAPLLVLNAWAIFEIAEYFHSLVVVLIAASLIAFLLNYPVSFMEWRGAKRERAAIIVFLLALSILLALGVTLFPLLLHQAQEFAKQLPRLVDSGQRNLNTLNDQLKNSSIPVNLDALEGQATENLKGQLQHLTGEALSIAALTVSSLLDLLLTFVLAFYLLQHGEQLWNSLIGWLPAKFHQPVSQALRLSFQNFFIGQVIMASCLGLSLTIVFLLLGVHFGLLFGLTIGVMALVPFGGTLGILLITLLVTFQDPPLGLRVLIACVLVQQILENLVAPRVLGKVTGLNPFWVLISILAGARVGGLLGVIVAVPIAVVIKNAIAFIRSDSPNADAMALVATAGSEQLLVEGGIPVAQSIPPISSDNQTNQDFPEQVD